MIWPFWTTLSAILCSIFSTLKPGVVLFSTMKPLTWLSATSRAQMIETSHHGALPIHRFWPLRIQVSPSRFAVVGQAAARSRPDQRLGQAEAADLFPARHRRQPLLLLLLRSVEIDRAHRQAAVHAEERAERRVDACHLHRDEAEQLLASAGAAVALIAQATELQFLEGRQQLERKRIVGPVLVDDRLDLGLHVRAHLLDDRLFLGGQDIRELVEVAVRRGNWLRWFLCRCDRCSEQMLSLLLPLSGLPRSFWNRSVRSSPACSKLRAGPACQ